MAVKVLKSVLQMTFGVKVAGVIIGVTGFGDTFREKGADSDDTQPDEF